VRRVLRRKKIEACVRERERKTATATYDNGNMFISKYYRLSEVADKLLVE
jgi:hypothetical protein